ncbi:hypothetical protein ACFOD0_09085 [Shewanella intestini]|uniref:Secreted protein n=1 Tax=Shewanella intestini TaxID=2017544 RepID=A0ABS5I4D3_9GAMM|nr:MULTISPECIES: hypothetical protein [Shewanella]MBR9728165.1 hypothetical protein [Shewanella intestini]MRG36636.1 hypothetical protein [Shewanella sp. XMDDZSB0408]
MVKKSLSMLVLGLSTSVFSLTSVAASAEQDAFLENIKAYCGQAFAGKVVSTDAADKDFASQHLVMHVRECDKDQVKIPFHVGEDHSRTWVLTKSDQGIQLKHDHRHKDGTEDAVTMYGGDTADKGTAHWQSFPVDAFSIANFTANGLTASVTNVWHMGIADNTFTYQLTRENRNFEVVFDLSKPVPLPPTPWGHK